MAVSKKITGELQDRSFNYWNVRFEIDGAFYGQKKCQ
jgi:hypothetical protein